MKTFPALQSALVLALFALAAAALLAGLHQLTDDPIRQARHRAQLAALSEILPATRYDNNILADTIEVVAPQRLGSEEPLTVYRARRDGKPVAVVMEVVAPKGYNGPIHMLVGIQADGTLAGVRVTRHQETPGLGDKIETSVSDWIYQFEGLSLGKPPADDWALKQDGGVFDQFTGASITPRAVVNAIKDALIYFRSHKQMLFARNRPNANAQPQ